MTEAKIKTGEWVVVCDGRKALILTNSGDAVFPNLQTKETHEQVNPKTSEQGADRPGRVHESASARRSAVAQTDFHDQHEHDFVVTLAERLDEAVSGGETKSLIVVAPPRALGMLRDAYSPPVLKAVRMKIAKDYVKMPVHEIEKRLLAEKA